MKLSITQIVLGVLVVVAACYIVGWMVFGVPSLLNMPVPDESGVMSYADAIPEHEALFTADRSAAGLVFVLGLVSINSRHSPDYCNRREEQEICQDSNSRWNSDSGCFLFYFYLGIPDQLCASNTRKQ